MQLRLRAGERARRAVREARHGPDRAPSRQRYPEGTGQGLALHQPFADAVLRRGCVGLRLGGFGTKPTGSMRDGDWLVGWGCASAFYPTQAGNSAARVRLTADGPRPRFECRSRARSRDVHHDGAGRREELGVPSIGYATVSLGEHGSPPAVAAAVLPGPPSWPRRSWLPATRFAGGSALAASLRPPSCVQWTPRAWVSSRSSPEVRAHGRSPESMRDLYCGQGARLRAG